MKAGPSSITYSVVIGALNEEKYIENTLTTLSTFLKKINVWQQTEIVMVVPPGNDNTLAITKRVLSSGAYNHSQLLRPKKRVGKGRDIRLGVMAGRGEYIIFFDADEATPIRYLGKLLKMLKNDECDMVFGKRDIWHMHNKVLRNISSGISNLVIRLLAGTSIKDSQCGFKGFTRKAARDIFSVMDTKKWSFDVELYVRAKSNSYNLAWLPVEDWKDPKTKADGLSGERQVKAMAYSAIELLRIAAKRFSGYYLPKEKQVVRRGVIKSMLIGIVWFFLLHVVFIASFGLVATDQPNVEPVRPGLFQAVYNFDSPFYSEIAQYGYAGTGSVKHLAFYPLYPLLLRFFDLLFLQSVDIKIIAFMINAVCVAITACVLYKIGDFFTMKWPIYVVIAWLLFPWALFMGAMYTEALFCLLVGLAILYTIQKRWYLAAVIAGLASLTRLPGVLVGVLVVFEYCRQVLLPYLQSKDKRNLSKLALKFVFLSIISVSGLIAWFDYQWLVFGSPFAFREAYELLWSYQVFSLNIFLPLINSTQTAVTSLAQGRIEVELFEIGSWLLALFITVMSMFAKIKVPKGWYVYILGNLILVLLNSNTVSVNRYILPILVLYPMLIMLMYKLPQRIRTPVMWAYFGGCLTLQLLMAVRLVNFAWVG